LDGRGVGFESIGGVESNFNICVLDFLVGVVCAKIDICFVELGERTTLLEVSR
jgi:hypothetical protein